MAHKESRLLHFDALLELTTGFGSVVSSLPTHVLPITQPLSRKQKPRPFKISRLRVPYQHPKTKHRGLGKVKPFCSAASSPSELLFLFCLHHPGKGLIMSSHQAKLGCLNKRLSLQGSSACQTYLPSLYIQYRCVSC